MARTDRSKGYTLIELLVVLVIIGVLSVVGVYMMIGNRTSAGVRALMDELEGEIMLAQKQAVATSQDVTVVAQGDWDPNSATPAMIAFSSTPGLTVDQIIANGLNDAASFKMAVNGVPPNASLAREHMYAGVVTSAQAAWWGVAMSPYDGRTNQNIAAVLPFSTSGSAFYGILGASAQNLFQGGAAAASAIKTVSGTNKRFQQTFWIEIVSLRGGYPVAGGAMGVLVVLANGGTVYKFYNPGVINGDGVWRRI